MLTKNLFAYSDNLTQCQSRERIFWCLNLVRATHHLWWCFGLGLVVMVTVWVSLEEIHNVLTTKTSGYMLVWGTPNNIMQFDRTKPWIRKLKQSDILLLNPCAFLQNRIKSTRFSWPSLAAGERSPQVRGLVSNCPTATILAVITAWAWSWPLSQIWNV